MWSALDGVPLTVPKVHRTVHPYLFFELGRRGIDDRGPSRRALRACSIKNGCNTCLYRVKRWPFSVSYDQTDLHIQKKGHVQRRPGDKARSRLPLASLCTETHIFEDRPSTTKRCAAACGARRKGPKSGYLS